MSRMAQSTRPKEKIVTDSSPRSGVRSGGGRHMSLNIQIIPAKGKEIPNRLFLSDDGKLHKIDRDFDIFNPHASINRSAEKSKSEEETAAEKREAKVLRQKREPHYHTHHTYADMEYTGDRQKMTADLQEIAAKAFPAAFGIPAEEMLPRGKAATGGDSPRDAASAQGQKAAAEREKVSGASPREKTTTAGAGTRPRGPAAAAATGGGDDWEEDADTGPVLRPVQPNSAASPRKTDPSKAGSEPQPPPKQERRKCFNCGEIEPVFRLFKKCALCHEMKRPDPRYYCGVGCQAEDWEGKHKAEHKKWRKSKEKKSRRAEKKAKEKERQERRENLKPV